VLAVAGCCWPGLSATDELSEASRRRRLFSLAILVPLSVFAAFSLRHEVKLDWTGALWTAALPALGCAMIAGDATVSRLAGGFAPRGCPRS